jgi:hypothetical protein
MPYATSTTRVMRLTALARNGGKRVPPNDLINERTAIGSCFLPRTPVSVTLFQKFTQNPMLFLYGFHLEIASGQIHDSK